MLTLTSISYIFGAFIERAIAFIGGAMTFIGGAVMFIGGAIIFIDKENLAIRGLFEIAKVKVNRYDLR